ncbi:MAG: hypothetical protein UY48_C0052G0005, partial [Candidatus Gottesmanbacteria bacterium GW2011_GWB1_49_7]
MALLIGVLLFIGLVAYTGNNLTTGDAGNDVVFNLINITLTLFGFCFIGSIFDKTPGKLKKIEQNLAVTSMTFLTSTL